MAKREIEVNKLNTQSKKDVNKDIKTVKEKVNNKVQNEIDIEEEIDNEEEQTNTRGRKAGFTVETPIALIYITNEYRIDISDVRNKITQKLVTKKRANDGKNETEPWKKDDTYTEWVNTLEPFRSSFKSAFDRILDVMVEDGVKARERVPVEEFLKLYREKNDMLEKLFNTMFDEEQGLRDKKKVKGE